jgi:hypothetical protein
MSLLDALESGAKAVGSGIKTAASDVWNLGPIGQEQQYQKYQRWRLAN